MERIKKLYCVISEELFFEIRKYGLLADIDNIVGELLTEKVEELKRREEQQHERGE